MSSIVSRLRQLGVKALFRVGSADPDEPVDHFRQRIFRAFFVTGLVLGPLAMGPSILLGWREGLPALVAVNAVAYVSLVLLVSLRRFVSHEIVVIACLVLFYVIGLNVIITVGVLSSGLVVLFAVAVLAGLLLGVRAVYVALAANVLVIFGGAFLIYHGLFPRPDVFFASTLRAVTAGGGFIFFNAVTAVAASMVVGGLQAVAEREKSARAALRSSEAKYRELVQSANSAVLRLNGLGVVTFINSFAIRLFDRREEDVVGKPALGGLFPEHAVNVVAMNRLLAAAESPSSETTTEEVQHRLTNGDDLWIAWARRVIRDEHGHRVELLCVGNDITSRRRLEGRLRQAEKMEAIGTLAGGVAHDFNNILAVIMTAGELGRDSATDAEDRENYGEIILACHRARELVRQILTFSRKAEPIREPLLFAAVVRETMKFMRSSLPSTIEIRTHFEVHDSDSWIEADAIELHQVLMNLSTNAAHAMKERGGVLDVVVDEADRPEVDSQLVADLTSARWLRLLVRDNGCGMSKEVLNRVFDPYFTTKPKGEGTGLGLSVVHGIVRGYGGSIEIRSEPGEGTEVEIRLPRALRVGHPEEPEDIDLRRGNARLLVVDDEPAIVRALKRLLERLGYSVVGMSDSVVALERFRGAPQEFDLLLSDVTMPRMDGLTLAAEVRRIRADLPIILATGLTEQVAGNGGPAHTVLAKPVTVEDLTRAVREALERKPK
jgi:PAS domain S-box-containing protein